MCRQGFEKDLADAIHKRGPKNVPPTLCRISSQELSSLQLFDARHRMPAFRALDIVDSAIDNAAGSGVTITNALNRPSAPFRCRRENDADHGLSAVKMYSLQLQK